MKKGNPKEKLEPAFPEESGLIIEKILKKYGFWKIQWEGIDKFFESKVPTDRRNVFESLPGYKISKLVRKYAEGEISLENLPSFLEKELNISSQKAKNIAEELERKLLAFVKPIEKRKFLPPKISPPETKPMAAPPVEKPRPPRKPDIYREPTE